MLNHLYILLCLFPEQAWDYYYLSKNPNITWDIVCAHPDKPWNYRQLSANINITWQIVQNHANRPWDYRYLSANPNITPDIVQNNPDKPWDYAFLSRNINFALIALQEIKASGNALNHAWDVKYLLMNPKLGNTSAEVFDNYMQLKSDIYWLLCRNKLITWEHLIKYPKYSYYMFWISAGKNVTWDIIAANPQEKWNLFQISGNINTNISVINDKLSALSIDGLSNNPNLDLHLLAKWPNLRWNYRWISKNPALTYRFVVDNADKLEWKYVSMNKFNKHYHINKLYLMRKYFQIWLRQARFLASYRRQYKILYDLCVHELKMRFRDQQISNNKI